MPTDTERLDYLEKQLRDHETGDGWGFHSGYCLHFEVDREIGGSKRKPRTLRDAIDKELAPC